MNLLTSRNGVVKTAKSDKDLDCIEAFVATRKGPSRKEMALRFKLSVERVRQMEYKGERLLASCHTSEFESYGEQLNLATVQLLAIRAKTVTRNNLLRELEQTERKIAQKMIILTKECNDLKKMAQRSLKKIGNLRIPEGKNL